MARAPDGPVALVSDQERIRATYRSYEEGGRDRLWDRSNRGFARLSDDRDAAVLDLFTRSIPDRSARILDIGCGDGTLIRTIKARWPDVDATGIDLLSDRIEEARSTEPVATFVVGSADALPFDDDSFDVLSAITLMSSIPSEEMEAAVAREIDRVLRPSGWLVWYDLRYDNPSNNAVHGVAAARLSQLFPGWRQELRSITLLPPIARRLGRLTRIGYPILEGIPPLRSHLIGRLQCPS